MRGVKFLLLVVLSGSLFAQYYGRHWYVIGSGPLSSRPARCRAMQDVYVCFGEGCSVPTIYYCVANNTWLGFGGVGGQVGDVSGGSNLSTPGSTVIVQSKATVTENAWVNHDLVGRALRLIAQAADPSNPLRNSPWLDLTARYWTGSTSADVRAMFRHVPLSTTQPNSQLELQLGGTTVLNVRRVGPPYAGEPAHDLRVVGGSGYPPILTLAPYGTSNYADFTYNGSDADIDVSSGNLNLRAHSGTVNIWSPYRNGRLRIGNQNFTQSLDLEHTGTQATISSTAGNLVLASPTQVSSSFWHSDQTSNFRIDGRLDASQAASTKPLKVVSELPSTCSVGEYVMLSSATAGQNTYACTSENTWTLQGDGGGGGGGGSSTFLGLTDTPSTYSGQGGKIVAVNNAENALEFRAAGYGLEMGTTLSIDTSIVPTMSGNNTWSGTNTFANATTVTAAGYFDATSAARTAPNKSGTTLPSTCVVGDTFFKVDAPAGQNLYLCTSANTWTQIQGSGGSSTFLGLTDTPSSYSGQAGKVVKVNQTEDGLTFGTESVTSVFGRTGAVTAQAGDYNFSQIAGQASKSQLPSTTVHTDQSNTWTAGAQDFSAAGSTKPMKVVSELPTSCSVGEYVMLSSAPAGQNTYACTSANTWTLQGDGGGSGGGSTTFLGLSDTPSSYSGQSGKLVVVNNAENALEFRPAGYGLEMGTTLSIDTSIVPTLSANNTWSGTNTFANATTVTAAGYLDATLAARTAPVKTGTTLPTTCVVGDIFFKSDAQAGQNLYLCTSANTWTQVQSGSGGSSTFIGLTDTPSSYTGQAGKVVKVNQNEDGLTFASESVTSVFGRTGAVTAQAGDYNFSQIAGQASKSQLPSTTVYTDQSNTWTAGTQDFSGAGSTKPMKVVDTLPSTCSVGEYVMLSSAPAGQNTYACTSQNTWSLQGDGSGNGGGYDPLDRSTFYYVDDFWGISSTLWYRQGSGWGSNVGDAEHPQVMGIRTTADSGTWSSLSTYVEFSGSTISSKDWIIESIVSINSTTDLQVCFGFSNSNNLCATAAAAQFLFDTSVSSNWIFRTCHATNCTNVDTQVQVQANTWYRLRIWKSGGVIYGSINGGTPFSSSTNLPGYNAFMVFVINTKAARSGWAWLWIDWFAMKISGLTR